MAKQHVVKVSAKIHHALEDASRQTGLSIYELADGILRAKLIPGLPLSDKDPAAELYEKVGKAYLTQRLSRFGEVMITLGERMAEIAAKCEQLTEQIKAHPEIARKLFESK